MINIEEIHNIEPIIPIKKETILDFAEKHILLYIIE